MPIVPAICTQCGAQLDVDDSKEAAVCPYCNTAFIVEKAINNYYNTYVTNIGSIHANNVYFSGDQKLEEHLRSGVAFLRLTNYKSAKEVFQKVTEDYPYDYRGWYGLIRTITKEFTEQCISRGDMQEIQDLLKKIEVVASEEQKNKVFNRVNQYCNPILQDWKILDEERRKKQKKLDDQYRKDVQRLEQERDELQEKMKAIKSPQDIVGKILIVFSIGMIIMATAQEGIVGLMYMIFGTAVFSAIVLGIVSITIQIPFNAKRDKVARKIQKVNDSLDEKKKEYKEAIKNLNVS